ncbi:DUF6608 family protein [Gudongella sp. DL1XJH-153]|uniref:DUF6608 family protein n=1 Tax=Gudongella sp. DL1XJH-153 TaxID=3409804 RepID=UPI003BB491A6
MINKIANELKRGLILFSVIFSFTTVLSSSIQLYQGQVTDTNFHIINRAAVVLIAVMTIILWDRVKLKNRVLTYLVPYSISMGVVFLYVWFTGFFQPLHPDAYRDIFLNFTVISILVMTVIFVRDKLKTKNSTGSEDGENKKRNGGTVRSKMEE